MAMIQVPTMCKETRILIDLLSSLGDDNNITPIFTTNEVMYGEWLCLRYYTSPMVSIIKHDISTRKSKLSSRQLQPSYWLDIIPNKLKNTPGVMRDGAVGVGLPGNPGSFGIISKYQVADYSVADAYRIYNLITTHMPQMIQYGVQVARSNNVYSMAYVEAVIKKETAISNIKRHEVQQRLDKAAESNAILSKQRIHNTQDDIESGKQHWQALIEDVEIEKMLEDIYGE